MRPKSDSSRRTLQFERSSRSGFPPKSCDYRLTIYREAIATDTVINGFACKDTERLYRGERVRRWSDDVGRAARRKLAQIAVSLRLSDLAVPPGNHLEVLKGARKGQHSIRVNDQWRLCFVWRGDAAAVLELIYYH